MQSLTLPRRVGVTGLGPKNLGSALNIAIPVAVAALTRPSPLPSRSSLWRSSQTAPAPRLSVADDGRVNLPYRYEPNAKPAPSGFRRATYLPHIYAAEAKYSLPAGLLDALVWTESRYNPLAVSPAGAVGLGQLMPATAKELGVSNRFDPMANIFGAARYLRQMLDRFGLVHLAVAAYNAGPGAVERVGGIPRNGETPEYVRNVLQRWKF